MSTYIIGYDLHTNKVMTADIDNVDLDNGTFKLTNKTVEDFGKYVKGLKNGEHPNKGVIVDEYNISGRDKTCAKVYKIKVDALVEVASEAEAREMILNGFSIMQNTFDGSLYVSKGSYRKAIMRAYAIQHYTEVEQYYYDRKGRKFSRLSIENIEEWAFASRYLAEQAIKYKCKYDGCVTVEEMFIDWF